MKNLQKLAKRAMEELDVIGVPYANVESFTVNTRAKQRWGQCCKSNGKYTINISIRLLADDLKDEYALDTIIHELIHTCPNCMNHGEEWQKWAELVNDCYACYNIQRCSSCADKGLEYVPREKHYNWEFECPECGSKWKYQRQPKWCTEFNPMTNEMAYAKCPTCHKHLKITKGDKSRLTHTYIFSF